MSGCTFLPVNDGSTDRHDVLRSWILGTCAVLLSAASAFCYLGYVGQGIAVGDWLGVRGREPDVAIMQRWATYWLMASVSCWAAAGVTAALALPIYAEASRLPRFFARLVLTSISSLVLAVIVGWVMFSILTASHHSVIH